MKTWLLKGCLLLLATGLIFVPLAYLFCPLESMETMPQASASVPSQLEPIQLDASVLEHRQGELVFDCSAEDFCFAFNRLYVQNRGMAYLGEPSQWRVHTQENAVHSDYETTTRTYSSDERLWSMPTITAYVPSDADLIQAITVNFDEHSMNCEIKQKSQQEV